MVDTVISPAANDDVSSIAILCQQLIGYCEDLLILLEYEEDLVTLRLWSEGFRAGDLLEIFAYSRDIKLSVLRNITTLSYDLQKSITRQSTLKNDAPGICSLLQLSLNDAKHHLSQLQPGTVFDELDAYSSAEESDISDTEDDSRIRFRLKLLMSIVPSMKRTLNASNHLHNRMPDSAQLEPTSKTEQKKSLHNQWDSVEASTTGIKDIRLSDNNKPVEKDIDSLPAYYSTAQIEGHLTTPLLPVAPSDQKTLRFRNLMFTLSVTPINYENPGLLDEALTHVPVDRLYTEAEEEHNILKAVATSSGNSRAEWGYQDCVIKCLLRWFSREFFEFVANPRCSECYGTTLPHGNVPPTDLEAANGATRVELYKCSLDGHFERFPRYASVWKLLETRRGRAGEFSNCFAMLCRAAGAQIRWIWCSEDAIWIEVYSEHNRRWVHVDACEEIWDNPRVYTEGWGRKIAYCIAFSIHGATDVTRRYVRDPELYGLPRDRANEAELLSIILEIRKVRRKDLEKEERRRLMRQDDREENELRLFRSDALKHRQASNPPHQSQQDSARNKKMAEQLGALGDEEAERQQSAIQAATHAMGRAS